MIIDVHTHFMDIDKHWSPQVFEDCRRCGIDPTNWRFTAEDHLKVTEPCDVSIVFGMQAKHTGWDIPNDVVAEHVQRARQRLIFFTSVDPSQPGFMEELERTHQDMGAKGVKIAPIYQGVHPLDKRYYQIYGYCQKHGLPFLTHTGTTFSSGAPLEYSRPVYYDQIAVDFPDLKIIMAHLSHPWGPECVAAIRHQPNLYADLSALYYRPWQFYETMRLVVEYRTQNKVLFGSDYPATTPAGSLEGVRNLNAVLGNSGLPPVSSEAIEEIIHADALTLLGLENPAKGASA